MRKKKKKCTTHWLGKFDGNLYKNGLEEACNVLKRQL